MTSIQYRSLSNVATETPLGIKCLICLNVVTNIFFIISFTLQAFTLNDMDNVHIKLEQIVTQLNSSQAIVRASFERGQV